MSMIGRGTGDIAARRRPNPLSRHNPATKIALETLIEPELLITARQLFQVFLHIRGERAHRDHAITIGIDVVGGQRIKQYFGDRTVSPFFVLARDFVRRRGCEHRHIAGSHY
jgi:hypothetical protein